MDRWLFQSSCLHLEETPSRLEKLTGFGNFIDLNIFLTKNLFGHPVGNLQQYLIISNFLCTHQRKQFTNYPSQKGQNASNTSSRSSYPKVSPGQQNYNSFDCWLPMHLKFVCVRAKVIIKWVRTHCTVIKAFHFRFVIFPF